MVSIDDRTNAAERGPLESRRELRAIDDGSAQGRMCGVCQTPVQVGEAAGVCVLCETLHHEECWRENGGCSAYGCAAMPDTVKDGDDHASSTYWGQETKQCPACGREIKVAALRCRYCGQLFADRTPEGGVARAAKPPPSTRTSVWLLVLALVPVTAPLALVWGSVWWLTDRTGIRALPSTSRIMLVLALIVSAVCTVVLAIAAGLHSLLG